jgi:hypothetical protein
MNALLLAQGAMIADEYITDLLWVKVGYLLALCSVGTQYVV